MTGRRKGLCYGPQPCSYTLEEASCCLRHPIPGDGPAFRGEALARQKRGIERKRNANTGAQTALQGGLRASSWSPCALRPRSRTRPPTQSGLARVSQAGLRAVEPSAQVSAETWPVSGYVLASGQCAGQDLLPQDHLKGAESPPSATFPGALLSLPPEEAPGPEQRGSPGAAHLRPCRICLKGTLCSQDPTCPFSGSTSAASRCFLHP